MPRQPAGQRRQARIGRHEIPRRKRDGADAAMAETDNMVDRLADDITRGEGDGDLGGVTHRADKHERKILLDQRDQRPVTGTRVDDDQPVDAARFHQIVIGPGPAARLQPLDEHVEPHLPVGLLDAVENLRNILVDKQDGRI